MIFKKTEQFDVEKQNISETPKECTDSSVPKVFICSRTHKQMDQLIDQLKKKEYKPTIAILGSRSQYCINPTLKNAVDINTACRDLVDTKRCIFRSGVSRLKKHI